MKKLALKLEELRVESYDTSSSEPDTRGTVHGHNSLNGTCHQTCLTCQVSCNGLSCFSCFGSCALSECYGNSCAATCQTCGYSCYACA